MARAALNRALRLGLAGLALGWLAVSPLRADLERDELRRRQRQADESVWQAVFGQHVVAEARKQLGKPYVWGEKTGEKGFDCSGYTSYVFRSLGVDLGTSAMAQYQQGVGIERGALMPGDLVFFLGKGSPLHVGIYEGGDRFLHAPATGKVIESSPMDSKYFGARFIGGRRVTLALDEARRRAASKAAKAPEQASPHAKKETRP